METGFCRAKHAAHVVSTNFAIFGLGFVGVLPRRLPDHVQRLQLPGLLRLDKPLSPDRLIDFGDWTGVPVGQERLRALRGRVQRPGRGVLPLHGRVHGHDGDHPDRRDGRAVEVEGVRRLGPVLRRPLLPDLRWLDLGRRLAEPARQQHRPRLRLRRLRRLRAWCTRWVASPASPVRSCSVPASASTVPTASRARWRRTASRWRCSARSSCCSGGSGSTRRRRSRRPTCASPWSRSNTAIAAAFGATDRRCSTA